MGFELRLHFSWNLTIVVDWYVGRWIGLANFEALGCSLAMANHFAYLACLWIKVVFSPFLHAYCNSSYDSTKKWVIFIYCFLYGGVVAFIFKGVWEEKRRVKILVILFWEEVNLVDHCVLAMIQPQTQIDECDGLISNWTLTKSACCLGFRFV